MESHPRLTRLIIVAMCAVLLAGSASAQRDKTVLTWTDCPLAFGEIYNSHSVEISCGWLPLLEDRAAPAGRIVQLFVAVVAAEADRRLPPMLYIAGGPGDAASSVIRPWLAAGMNQRQDLIFVDLRGSGLSEPSLNCPEMDQPDEEDRLRRCRDRLLAEGVDLTAYNEESLSHDIADLITVMQLESVSVYAHSYGARLALRLAALAPQRIHAMVLDSAYRPGESALVSMAANLARALARLFADCGAAPVCAGGYPNLASQLETAVTRLTAAPAEVEELPGLAAIELDGASSLLLLRDMLADSDRLAVIPAFIAAIAAGDYAALAEVEAVGELGESRMVDGHSEGLYMSVFCAEAAATSADEVSRAAEYLPAMFAPVVRASLNLLADCAVWLEPLTARDRTTILAPDVPMLWLDGRYDPVTPETSTFTSAPVGWRYTDPRAGHGVLLPSKCARLITLAFLAEPAIAPQHSCMQAQQPIEFHVGKDE